MNQVEKWLKDNTAQLERVLSDYSDTHVYHGRRHRREHRLSDMGLCHALGSGKIDLPESYFVIGSTVQVEGEKKIYPHYVGYDGTHLLDLLSGQFLRDKVNNISGIATMLDMAPQLFYVLSDELVALHATVEEVRENLRLNYTLIK